MFSATDPSRPILLFVGRPLDPNKGLVTFLDALEHLLSLSAPATFAAWLVGGDDDELPHIHAMISVRPRLRHEAEQGRLLIWGKVKRDALPELYRRSLAVVMPSFREQFGLVAIEAMACGVPVVGTKQGGIDDTVLAGLTGATVEVDQPDALAGALLLYLRGPALRKTRGRLARAWAETAFSKSNTYSRMAGLYTAATLPELRTDDWDLRRDFHAAEVAQRIRQVETIIGRSIFNWNVIAARHHVIARIETCDGPLALKVFRDRPSLSAAMLPVGAAVPTRTAKDFVDNATYHANNPCVPPLVAVDGDLGVAIHAWADVKSMRASAADLVAITEGFARYGTSKTNQEPERERFASALDVFLGDRNEHNLEQLDLASMALNRVYQRTGTGIRSSHPVAELTRVVFCLDTRGWPIPGDIRDRIRMVVFLLLSKWTPVNPTPRLCHGGLISRRLYATTSGLQAFDTEHSTFAVGELDLGIHAAGEIAHGMSVFNVVRDIYKVAVSPAIAVTALQWMAYFLVHGYLEHIHHGRTFESGKLIRRAFSDLALALA